MAKLIVHNPPRAVLKASGYTGSPEGNIELTENNKTYDVSDFATATTSIPEPPEPTGTKEIIENGIHDVKEYAFANVKVPEPSGTITLDENNRSYDVTDYAAADVAIPEEEKTVTPSTTRQEITPDNGLLSKVTVLPASLEERTVTPTAQQQVVTPTAPNIGLSSVTVEGYVPPAPVEEKFINFIDYDGTLLYSWTEQELQAATELPPLPTRTGYTYQEWNWDLADLKRYDMSLYVGAIMKPANGETQIHIQTFDGDPLSTQLNVNIKLGTISIDWGDGTPTDSVENNRDAYSLKSVSHTYETTGKYIIKISFTGEGEYAFKNTHTLTEPYLYRITEVNIGDFCVELGYMAFGDASALRQISISKECLNLGGGYVFQGVLANYIVLPKRITTINRLFNSSRIRVVSLPFITNFISTATEYTFKQSSIAFIRLLGLTTINLNMFTECSSLCSIIIPSTVTSIESNAFASCKALTIIDLSQYDDVNSIPALANTDAFRNINSNAVFQFRNQEMLDAFAGATNWSTYADRFQIKGA